MGDVLLLRNLVRKFVRDRRGAVAIIYALTLIPILGFIGGAVDYGRAYIVKARLQEALDSAVLAAGATTTLTNDERIAYAKKLFDANYPAKEMGIAAEPVITISEEGVIKGTVTANLDSAILGVIGIDNIDVGAASEASIVSVLAGEIVLVLDYSGSMNEGRGKKKYKVMRDAAIDLIDTLSEDGKNDKVKFGLVPFSAAVYTTLPKSYVVDTKGGGDWTGCTDDRMYDYNIGDSTPTSNDATKWGCHIDEVFDKHDDDWKKGGYEDCKEFKEQCSAYKKNDVVIRALTNDFTAVKKQLKDMEPIGNTHISLGMAFGWHVISPTAPWTEGVAYDDDEVLKAIVLLTDGKQTSAAWGPGNSYNVGNANDNLEDICEAVKEKGVMVLTVAFDLDDEDTKERLEDCATSKSHYFDADDNDELAKAFKAITSQLVKNLHLSK